MSAWPWQYRQVPTFTTEGTGREAMSNDPMYNLTPSEEMQMGIVAEIERLRGLLANSEMTVAEVMADNERLQEHKRKQAADIMTLGQMVGKLEAERAELLAALVFIARTTHETTRSWEHSIRDMKLANYTATAAIAKAEKP
jgi:hypothetical protein